MNASPTPAPDRPQTARVAVSWALVGVPLAYGLYNAVQAAAKLFTG